MMNKDRQLEIAGITATGVYPKAATGIFADRRQRQIPFPANRCRRRDSRTNDVYDARPWWLKVNYLKGAFRPQR